MLHTLRLRTRTSRALTGAIAGLLLLTGTAAACPDDLRDLGAANVQGNNFWGIEVVTRDNVITGGYTYARVTDQACTSSSPSAVIFETRLEPTESGDGNWVGLLAPVGAPAERIASRPDFEGQVYVEPAGNGSRVTSHLQGVPGNRDFRVCLGSTGH